jgi:hypothetical protein
MAETDFRPCFIEPGSDQDKSLSEPLCILRERGEDDRRAFARIRQVVAKALAEAKGRPCKERLSNGKTTPGNADRCVRPTAEQRREGGQDR